MSKKKANKRTGSSDFRMCFQLSLLIALQIWGIIALSKAIDKNKQIVQQELVNIKSRLEDKDLDIYTRVELHRQENILTYYNESFSEYRQLKRQILREYRQKARSEKVR